jgi:hypothetical protein
VQDRLATDSRSNFQVGVVVPVIFFVRRSPKGKDGRRQRRHHGHEPEHLDRQPSPESREPEHGAREQIVLAGGAKQLLDGDDGRRERRDGVSDGERHHVLTAQPHVFAQAQQEQQDPEGEPQARVLDPGKIREAGHSAALLVHDGGSDPNRLRNAPQVVTI